MLFDLSSETLCLMMIGGLAVSIGHAAIRRDPAWVLALGLPLLFCADRAGLPLSLVAWGCLLYVAIAGAVLIGLLARATGFVAAMGIVASVATLGLMTGNADARYLGFASASLHSPPAIGIRIEGLLHDVAGRD